MNKIYQPTLTSFLFFMLIQIMVFANDETNTFTVLDYTGNLISSDEKAIEPFESCSFDCIGDLTLHSQAEVDAFESCPFYDGSITIRGTDITDLSALDDLEEITGDLKIEYNSGLIILEGFNNLIRVGGELSILYNGQMTTINAFANLESVDEALTIVRNDHLYDMQFLSDSFTIGLLNFIQNYQITNLDGFYGLRGYNTMYIDNNSALENIDGLSNIPAIGGSIRLTSNSSLQNLNGISHLVSMQSLALVNTTFTSIDELSNLDTVRSLRIDYNSRLENLAGLVNLQSANFIRIAGNEVLSDCCGIYPALVASNANLEVWSNPTFCSSANDIRNFCSTTSCPGNVFLNSQAAVDAFDCQNAAGSIIIGGDTSSDIYDLSPLSGLHTIGEFLQIKNNPNLTSLEGLNALETVGSYLSITDNVELSECCGLYPLISNDGVGGDITMSGNPLACNSESELLASCAAALCTDDITLHSQEEVDAFGPCSYYDGSITIRGDDITNLSAFDDLEEITGDLVIESNANLLILEGFDNLSVIGGNLEINYNDQLATVNAFATLESIDGTLYFIRNNGLSNIQILSNSFAIGALYIIQNASLTNLDGLYGLEELGSIYFDNNPILENVDGLSNIPANMSTVRLEGNSSIQNVNGFSHFESLSRLELVSMDITSVDELSNLRSVEYLRIDYNNRLENLAGLVNLQSANSIRIAGNAVLSDCCGIYPVLIASDANLEVWSNPAFCNSESEILENCAPADYCETESEYPWHEWISKIELNTIDNVSEKTYYSDFTSLSTTLQKGNTYSISLETSFSYYTYDAYYRVWIDYNQNGDFTDPGEMSFEGILSNAPNGTPPMAIAGNISIPNSVLSGSTRMRVALQRGSAPTPCTNIPFGEVEDYTVELIDFNPSVLEVLCPEDIYLRLPANETGDYINWDLPTYSTTCPTANVVLDQTGGMPNGSYFSTGIYQIAYRATDDCANEVTCFFTIYVVEEEENCAPEGAYPWHEWISRVRVAGLDYSSEKSKYSDFTVEMGLVENGFDYFIRLTTSYSYDTYDEYWKVWIDYNQDNSFDESQEVAFAGILEKPVAGTPTKTLIGLISIPANALAGSTTMRISMKRGAYASPCEVFEFGEVEDYTIEIGDNINSIVRQNALRLDAQLAQSKVLLGWTANTSIEDDVFVIERSVDGLNFETVQEIEKVESDEPFTYYQAEDSRIGFGHYVYRIKQYFIDGSFRYSNIQSIDYALDEDLIIVFPNPVENDLFIDVNKKVGSSAVLQIQDLFGRLIVKRRIESLPGYPIRVDASGFDNGLYFMSIKVEDLKLISRKFIVEKAK